MSLDYKQFTNICFVQLLTRTVSVDRMPEILPLPYEISNTVPLLSYVRDSLDSYRWCSTAHSDDSQRENN